jgi:flavin reductase (DIM6/NTAB) family NADH-FMN oxidoreductase RutF
MSFAACTVSIVTTDGIAGRFGVTVSAMASVSADGDRPTLLVCIHHLSPTAAAILRNRVFCINILRDDQSHISDCFAGRLRTADDDKFSCARWTTETTGAPRLADPLVAFDCRLISGERIGTHHVFLGAVESIYNSDSGSPLIYAKRAYGTPRRLKIVGRSEPADGSCAISIGCYQVFSRT